MENNELKPFTLKQSIKLGFSIFFFGSILLVVFLFVIIGGINGLKEIVREERVVEIIKPILYSFVLLAFIIFLGIFITYKKRSDKTLPIKILTIQSPLIVMILRSFGISFDESNPKEFYFYYNLIFGISLVVLGFILFFVSNDYRMGLIPFGFGIFTILWGINKRK